MMILHKIRQFAKKEDGSYSAEAMLLFPLMAWAYIGMFIFFDAYRQQNVNLKASYTVGDMLSRETDLINDAYLDGMNKVLDYLTYSRHDTYLRVTVVYYDADTDKHMLVWSEGTRGKPSLNQEEVTAQLTPHIPIMADTDTAIVVETWAAYEPIATVGIPPRSFDNIVVTSPRFAPQLNFEGYGDGTGTTHDDGTDSGSGL